MFYARAKNSIGTAEGITLNFKSLVIDPSVCPEIIDPNVSTLVIQNFVYQFRTDPNRPNKMQGNFVYEEKSGNSELIDSNDASFTLEWDLQSKINSYVGVEYPDVNEPGTLKFKRKVYAGSGEDWANTYINDVRIQRWSGNKNWAEESYSLPAGSNNIRFTLEKSPVDSLVGEGFWLDDVQVIPNE